MKRVAIIGGGGSGLCAAKHLLSTARATPVIFEQSSNIGGTWVYEDLEESGGEPFSSVYKNLRTNLPKEVMLFPGFPYPSNLPSFIHHIEVRKYLERFAEHYQLHKCVKFRTKVTNIEPINDHKWKVTTIENKSHEKESVFDNVIVCNGHYSTPYYPNVPGIHHFTGQYLHSHYYRIPDQFSSHHKSALLLGIGPSAIDIAVELSRSFMKVHLSHRSERLQTPLPPNVHEIANISHVAENGDFVADDGFRVAVDLFIPCTGYKYTFPFLGHQLFRNLVVCRNRIVRMLYKHMFFMHRPSICFVGIPFTIAPFPFIHQQCAYAANVIVGKSKLPSPEDMLKDTEQEIVQRQSRGESERHFHKFEMEQFEFLDKLVSLSGALPNPPYIKALYDYVMNERKYNVLSYREENFKILDENTFLKR